MFFLSHEHKINFIFIKRKSLKNIKNIYKNNAPHEYFPFAFDAVWEHVSQIRHVFLEGGFFQEPSPLATCHLPPVGGVCDSSM